MAKLPVKKMTCSHQLILDKERCLKISKSTLRKQNNGPGILSKVLIKKSQKLVKVPKYWSSSQNIGQTFKILAKVPIFWPTSQNIGQSPKNWSNFQNIGHDPNFLAKLPKIGQSPKILGKLPKIGQTPNFFQQLEKALKLKNIQIFHYKFMDRVSFIIQRLFGVLNCHDDRDLGGFFFSTFMTHFHSKCKN